MHRNDTTYKGVLHTTHGITEDAQPRTSPTRQPQALAVTLLNPNTAGGREDLFLTPVTKDTEVPGYAQPTAQLLHGAAPKEDLHRIASHGPPSTAPAAPGIDPAGS